MLDPTDGTPFRVWEGILSREECRKVIEGMAAATAEPGRVLRRSRDEVDPRLRRCSEHRLPADQASVIVEAMRRVGGQAVTSVARLDGPKFCSYTPGQYFRAHRDRSGDPADPEQVRDRRVSLVCFLNDAKPVGGLPVFDGGALVLHVPSASGQVKPTNIMPGAGSMVSFASDLLHEVRPVRSGVRYTTVGWIFSSGE